MRISAVRTTLLQERVFWAREVERVAHIRTRESQPADRPAGRQTPPLGSVLVEIEVDEGTIGVGLGGGGPAAINAS